MDGQGGQDGGRGGGRPHPPAPSPTFGEGVDSRPVSGYGTCFRGNEGRTGAWIAAYAAMTGGWARCIALLHQ